MVHGTVTAKEERTEYSRHEITVASACYPGEENTQQPQRKWNDLLSILVGKLLTLLMGCDASDHNIIWNRMDTNNRGEYHLESAEPSNLEIFNIRNRPTFVTSIWKEVLNITIASPGIAMFIKDWNVSREESLSNHNIREFPPRGLGTLRNPRKNIRKLSFIIYMPL